MLIDSIITSDSNISLVKVGSENPSYAQDLVITTDAENDLTFFFLIIIFILLVLLTYLIADYAYKSGVLLSHKEE